MGKRPWTTQDQRDWLEALIPNFIQAQADLKSTVFLKNIYKEWHAKWPTPAPTEDEIKAAKGKTEKALVDKKKAAENVRITRLLYWIRNDTELTWTFQRVKFWFHNHTRGSSSGTGARGLLKLGPSTKNVQPWQAYLNKFQHTKLKDKIDDAWQQHLSEVPEGEKSEKTLFEIRNKLAQKLYAAETAEVKEEVEGHRKAMRDNNVDLDNANKAFQE
jgi:hypothetical protein